LNPLKQYLGGLNMQKPASDLEQACLTPRLELRPGGKVFSNLYDRTAQMEAHDRDGQIKITIRGTLCDIDGANPDVGAVKVAP